MKTKQSLFCGLIAVVSALIFTTCLSIAGGTRAHTHQWSEWTQVSGDDATEERVCKADSTHIQTRLTGTDRFTFDEIDETSYRVSYGSLRTGEVTIPAYYRPDADSEYLPVTEIGGGSLTGSFSGINITSLYISEGIAIIDAVAFQSCTSLASITLPKSLTFIDMMAFRDCRSLTSIIIPDGVTSISEGVFEFCTSLTSVTIPASVTSIGNGAFFVCESLASITIPASVTSIGSSAFRDCTSLASMTIPESVTSIGSWAFYNTAWLNSQPDELVYVNKILYAYKGTMPAIDKETIPAINKGTMPVNTVINNIQADTIAIADSAFYGCENLAGITIPTGVMSIGFGAFADCTSLASITLPASVISIGESAFRDCTSLASITLPAGVTFVGVYAFDNTAWLNSQPDGLVYVGKVLYTYKGTMPDNTVINNIRSDIIAISGNAFSDCAGLTAITIPTGVTFIGSSAFFYCVSLTSITIPAGVTSIETATFAYCLSLTDITIPTSVTSIGSRAFYVSSLASITIPASVTSIGGGAFEDWIASQTINVLGHVSQAAADAAWGTDWRSECRATINYLGK
jgi:hypothetical protein